MESNEHMQFSILLTEKTGQSNKKKHTKTDEIITISARASDIHIWNTKRGRDNGDKE